MTDFSQRKIPARKRFAYAAPAFSLAVVGIPVDVYIPKFYSDVVGVDIAVMSLVLFSMRLFDAVTDPLLGFLSDRTKIRFGRRRPYILTGSIFVVFAIAMLFNPPEADPHFETIWFGICIYSLFLFWTAVVVPYESLGPEITFDYDERTSLFGPRDGMMIAGTLAAASSPAVVAAIFGLPDSNAGEREKFFWISAGYTPLLIGSCWWCVSEIREYKRSLEVRRPGLFQGLRDVLRNRPFLILLVYC
jgi:GPH family glycoside/pentoside/hexuronide:cation symporter